MGPTYEFNFYKYLELGIWPIFIPPYWMAPEEYGELKTQLKVLLGKDFILQSFLHLDDPILFVKKKDGIM